MKISVCSDVHLEFGQLDLRNTDNADVLILSGDICTASAFENDPTLAGRYMEFFEQCNSEFPLTLMVMGNHEHYNGDFAKSYDRIKKALENLSNVHILAKETYEYMGHVFFGGTLWTDMNGNDEQTHFHVGRRMNDFRIVENSNRLVSRKVPIYKKDDDGNYLTGENGGYIIDHHEHHEYTASLSTHDVYQDHKDFLEALEVLLAYSEKPMIVLSHHAPSKKSTHPRYKSEVLMNGGYSSDLDNFIMDHSQIKLWTHGHTHEPFDYMIGSTRIVCNPRGYINYEQRADYFQLKTFEV